jgi:hypothetical protein
MLAKVGVRTWTRLGLREPSFQETLYMTSPRGASTRLVAVPVVKANFSSPVLISPGGSLAERLAKNLAALHDFEGAHQQAGADVAGGLHRHIELHLRVGRVGRGAAQVLGQAGGSGGTGPTTPQETAFSWSARRCRAARARRGWW